jgi:hypothetical protein
MASTPDPARRLAATIAAAIADPGDEEPVPCTVANLSPAAADALQEALLAVGHRSDWYQWADQAGLYISRETLLSRMATGSSVNVVDTRDDDVAGGMIRGARHMADGGFGAGEVLALLDPSHAADGALLVFHCMESARRGPRCARRMHVSMEALRRAGCAVPQVEVRVLQGGFGQWCRRFWQDASKVEGYDDDYWGFAEMGGTQLGGDGRHALYERPADQPATPWSGAGTQ